MAKFILSTFFYYQPRTYFITNTRESFSTGSFLCYLSCFIFPVLSFLFYLSGFIFPVLSFRFYLSCVSEIVTWETRVSLS